MSLASPRMWEESWGKRINPALHRAIENKQEAESVGSEEAHDLNHKNRSDPRHIFLSP